MDYLKIFLSFVLIIFTIIYYFYKKTNRFDKYGVPYIKPTPFFGNMAETVLRLCSMPVTVEKFYNYNKEAKYIGIFDFNNPTVLIRDPELIKEVTIKHFDNFVNHRPLTDPDVDPLFGNNLFSLKGDKWRDIRNLLSPSFTGSKMKGMFGLMSECSKNFSNYWVEKLKQGKVTDVNVRDAFTKYTTDVIATCAFGITTDSMRNPENEFYVIGSDSCHFRGIKGLKFFLTRSFPRACKLLGIRLMEPEVREFFYQIVRDTIAMRDEKGISRPDMIQLMMETRTNKPGHSPALNIEEMTAQAFVFFFAGFDTVSSLMCFAAHEISINADIQQKLKEEVDEVYQKCNGDVTYDLIKNMEYLDAIINETMRIHTLALALDRVCTKDFELPPALPNGKPYVLKAGDYVWIPAHAIHHDPEYFSEPNKFLPDRFLGDSKSILNSPTYIPFGIGPRICIGNRFAILETKVLLFYLIANFTLKPSKKMKLPLKYAKSITLAPEGGFWLDLESRNKTTNLPNGVSH